MAVSPPVPPGGSKIGCDGGGNATDDVRERSRRRRFRRTSRGEARTSHTGDEERARLRAATSAIATRLAGLGGGEED
jgi:hypothetical protein